MRDEHVVDTECSGAIIQDHVLETMRHTLVGSYETGQSGACFCGMYVFTCNCKV